MGHHAGFEEKEYETLINAALATSASMHGATPQLFSPGQALEKELGFDFSAFLDPSSRQYRLLFGTFHGPVLRTPGVAAAAPTPLPAGVPAVNIFLQYKRPEYFRANHRQPVWNGSPFIRFGVRSRYSVRGRRVVDHSQLEALDRLAAHKADWLVRYACPSVWTRPDLYASFSQSRLLDASCFVDPRHLARQPGGWHDYWTFDPNTPGVGQGNPGGPEVSVEIGLDFLSLASQRLIGRTDSFLRDVEVLDQQLSEVRRIERYFNQPSESDVKSQKASRSRNQSIERALVELDTVLLDAPLDEEWRTNRSNHALQPTARPSGSDREAIELALKVAATAAELGLTWIVRS